MLGLLIVQLYCEGIKASFLLGVGEKKHPSLYPRLKHEQGRTFFSPHQVYNNTLEIYLHILDCLNGQDWKAHSIC